jgi:hypothetical protein
LRKVHLLFGWWYSGQRFNRINNVIIPTRCIFFFGSLSRKNLQVKRAWLGAIWDGWPTGKFSRVRMSEDKVRIKDLCWSVGTIYDPRELPGVSTAGSGRIWGWVNHGKIVVYCVFILLWFLLFYFLLHSSLVILITQVDSANLVRAIKCKNLLCPSLYLDLLH